MGYTHYFSKKTTLPKEKWDMFVNEIKMIHKNLPEKSESAGGYHSNDLLKICGGVGNGNPVFSNKEIWFNGSSINDLDHETFCLERVKSKNNCNFCKTARKPYDLFVCLVLISAKKHFGESIKISSDGGKEDWKSAIDLYEKLTGHTLEFDIIVL